MRFTRQEAGNGQIKRAARRVLRNSLVLTTSALVVGGLVSFVLSPPSYRFELDVKESRLISAEQGGAPVVYGTVGDENGGIEGATVSLYRRSGDGEPSGEAVRSATTATDGTYRFETPVGSFTVVVSCSCHGTTSTGEVAIEIEPGRAYQVDASLTTEHRFVVAPVSGY